MTMTFAAFPYADRPEMAVAHAAMIEERMRSGDGPLLNFVTADDLIKSPSTCCAALIDTDAVAFLSYDLLTDHPARTQYLKSAVVCREHQGRGIMQRLIAWARCYGTTLAQAPLAGEAVVRVLNTGAVNEASRHAFRKNGFAVSGLESIAIKGDTSDRHLQESADGPDRTTFRILRMTAAPQSVVISAGLLWSRCQAPSATEASYAA